MFKISGLFLLVLFASCSSTVYQAGLQSKPVKTDGIPSEWSLPLRFSDVKSGLQYAITNDTGNLFLCIRATETSTQMRMLMSGIELWIDPSGKHKRTTQIKFPIFEREQRPMRMDGERVSRERRQVEIQKIILEKPHYILTSGFIPLYDGKILSTESKDVLAAINQDSLGLISVEYKIPFKTFCSMPNSLLQKEPVFGFEIVLPAARFPMGKRETGRGEDQQSSKEGMEEGEGRRQGGGNRMQGGGMEGGMGGPGGGMGLRPGPPGQQGSNSNQEDSVVKFKIKLNKGK
ncbi:MAG: hypothetical protein HXX13_09510 [Bacteroidetes bacterium]|nr:hypothetical protein [Bacteroidota bacterium]